jgi:hypothetical protein
MTQLLEKAMTAVNRLAADQQDTIAALILDELADERKWDDAFAGSQDKLAVLAKKARADRKAGRAHTGGWEDL